MQGLRGHTHVEDASEKNDCTMYEVQSTILETQTFASNVGQAVKSYKKHKKINRKSTGCPVKSEIL